MSSTTINFKAISMATSVITDKPLGDSPSVVEKSYRLRHLPQPMVVDMDVDHVEEFVVHDYGLFILRWKRIEYNIEETPIVKRLLKEGGYTG